MKKVLLFLTLVMSLTSFSQTNGTILGTVIDKNTKMISCSLIFPFEGSVCLSSCFGHMFLHACRNVGGGSRVGGDQFVVNTIKHRQKKTYLIYVPFTQVLRVVVNHCRALSGRPAD